MRFSEGQSAPRTVSAPARGFVLPGDAVGVLLVHGFAGSIADLRPLADRLQADGHTVVGVRLPGHGVSVDDLHASRFEDWSAEVRRALVNFPPHVTSVVMVGESMGGLLSLLASSADPRVKGIVLLVPPMQVTQAAWRASLSRLLPKNFHTKKPWIRTAAERRQAVDRGSMVELTVGSYRQFLRVTEAARRHLPDVRVPVLAFFSKDDHRVSHDSIRRLRSGLGGRIEIVEVNGDRHHLMTGPEAAIINATIRRFIEQVC